ncbi:MAG: NUDIX domain-containing protein [Pseudomonadota bacterium]
MVEYPFPRPAVTVDTIVFRVTDAVLEVLLIRRDASPFAGSWALPGGFVHEDEPLEATAARVLGEKAGVTTYHLEQLGTFGAPDRDPRDRVISVAYFAIINGDPAVDKNAEWFSVDDVPPTAFDHDHIIATAIQRLRSKLTYTRIGFAFVPDVFTLPQLQRTWEAVLKAPLDKRNFRKMVMADGQVIATGEKTRGGAHPPAMLYRTIQPIRETQ